MGWAIGDFLGISISRKIGGYSTSFWVFLFGLIIFSFYLPFEAHNFNSLTIPLIFLNIILGILFIAGNIAFNEGLRTSNASLVGTIAASFTAITVVLSILFLGENITLGQTAVIVLIFIGIILSTLNFGELRRGDFIKDKGVRLALFSMLAWGIYFAFIKILVRQIGWFLPHYISFLLFPLIFLYMKLRNIPLEKPNKKNGVLLLVIISAILVRIGDFSFNLAIGRGLTSIVAPIAGSYPTLFVFLSFLIFKDPIKKQQILGIIITIIGIFFLSFISYY